LNRAPSKSDDQNECFLNLLFQFYLHVTIIHMIKIVKVSILFHMSYNLRKYLWGFCFAHMQNIFY